MHIKLMPLDPCLQVMTHPHGTINDLRTAIVAKMGEVALPKVEVIISVLSELGRFSLKSLTEKPIDKEHLAKLITVRAGTTGLHGMDGLIWAETFADFTGMKFSPTGEPPPQAADSTGEGRRALCAGPLPVPPRPSPMPPTSTLLTSNISVSQQSAVLHRARPDP